MIRRIMLKAKQLNGNPPIHKNEIESKVVVQDGDTIAIGGVVKSQLDKTVAGLPWFQKIPVLGWLFKTENVDRTNKQLMIFVTPKILSGSGYIEDECAMGYEKDNFDKCRSRE